MRLGLHTVGGLAAAVVLAACGGPTSGTGASAGPDGAPVAADETGAAIEEGDEAQKRFAALSKKLDKLGKDDAIDPDWLERELEAVLDINSDHSAAKFNLAVLAEKRGDVSRANSLYEEILDEDSDFAPARENLAARYVQQGKVEDAEDIYASIVGEDKKNTTSRLGLARIRFSQKRYQEAIDLCRQVLQSKADAIEAFRVLARSYKEIGNIPMSELIIGRGLKVDKEDIELHYLMAQILLERDDLAGGVGKLKEVIRMDPKRLDVRARLAGIALEYRDYGNAAQQYEAILKEKEGMRAAQVGLAVAYKGLGRYQQSADIYKKLLQKNSQDADALWNLAVLQHRHLNQYDDAIASYKKYESVAPEADKKAAKVAGLIKKVEKAKNNLREQQERAEREQRRAAAIQASCAAVEAGKQPNKQQVGDIGNENERIEVAWQLMVDAQTLLQNGDMPGGESRALCAFGILPDSQQAKVSACAPMYVHWTQILYQLNRLEDADKAIDKALACDPENPDAQLIKQQLAEIVQQQAGEGGGAR